MWVVTLFMICSRISLAFAFEKEDGVENRLRVNFTLCIFILHKAEITFHAFWY